MVDEKDLEIARLKGALEATQARQGSVAGGTLKVVGTLLALGAAVLLVLVILGNTIAKPKPYAEQIADCETQNAGFDQLELDCKIKVTAAEMDRNR
ncbi:MAG: hypothetical protein JHC81_04770 [Brevundimonas sp.]|uniref:hypothetical protein n=1 Tax=Brevundimonas sp. TaxID=1871086 RepID=UPI001A2D26FD|nr:hypothetical protein [Brevundimonas sp.]MBJ7446827.1 hypothetical protein [Brevundimonas sp.]